VPEGCADSAGRRAGPLRAPHCGLTAPPPGVLARQDEDRGPPRIVRAARPLVDSRARRMCSRAAAVRLGVSMRLLVSLVRREGASNAAPRK
jgi:hypothetical protein